MSSRSRARDAVFGFVAVVCLALGSCTTTYHDEPALLSARATVLDAPLVRQDELYECGLVALSSLCQYHAIEIPDEERVALARRAAESQGLSGDELCAALESHGMSVHLFSGALDKSELGLLHHIDCGRPLIVMTTNGDVNHYCLFIGYDPEFDNVVLLDPRRGRVVTPTTVFNEAWRRADRFTLLAVPRDSTSPSISLTAN